MDKMEIMFELYLKAIGRSPLIYRFFDPNSTKKLDQKIRVLTELVDGKPMGEIPDFYEILEDYDPEAEIWD